MLITTSYAVGDTKTPTRYAIYRVVSSTIVSVILMQWLDVLGVVLGAVFAAWVETIALGIKLRAQIGGLGLDQVKPAKTLLLGALSVGPAVLLRWLLPEGFASTLPASLLVLGVFGGSFTVAAPLLRPLRRALVAQPLAAAPVSGARRTMNGAWRCLRGVKESPPMRSAAPATSSRAR